MKTTERLTRKQKDLVEDMRRGWSLVGNLNPGWNICWLEKEGIAVMAPKSTEVKLTTVKALLRKGIIIVRSREFPIVRYKLTEG